MKRAKASVLWFLVLAAGFAAGHFTANVSAIRDVAAVRWLQEAGLSLARSVSRARGLDPNEAHPERRGQFALFQRRGDVVMVGDSITQAGIWEDMFPDVRIVNRGLGADRTDDVLRRMSSILSVRPKRAFVMLGINDFSAGRTVGEVFDDYVRIVNALQSGGVSVVIQSTIECSVELMARCTALLPDIRELNLRLGEHALKNNLHFADINAGITSPHVGLLKPYTTDGVHLSATGYEHWRESIRPLVYGQ